MSLQPPRCTLGFTLLGGFALLRRLECLGEDAARQHAARREDRVGPLALRRRTLAHKSPEGAQRTARRRALGVRT